MTDEKGAQDGRKDSAWPAGHTWWVTGTGSPEMASPFESPLRISRSPETNRKHAVKPSAEERDLASSGNWPLLRWFHSMFQAPQLPPSTQCFPVFNMGAVPQRGYTGHQLTSKTSADTQTQTQTIDSTSVSLALGPALGMTANRARHTP